MIDKEVGELWRFYSQRQDTTVEAMRVCELICKLIDERINALSSEGYTREAANELTFHNFGIDEKEFNKAKP